MNIKVARKLKKLNQHLIGENYRDGIIEQVYLYPNDERAYETFMKCFLQNFNDEICIRPFSNMDIRIGVLMDKYRIDFNGVLLYTDIENLKHNFDVIFDIPNN